MVAGLGCHCGEIGDDLRAAMKKGTVSHVVSEVQECRLQNCNGHSLFATEMPVDP
jgi:hypothetical protein